jgi:hypothetical protein
MAAPSRRTLGPLCARTGVLCRLWMHARGNELDEWRVLRPVYRFSRVVAPPFGMLVVCHIGT